jgi:sugar phosphate isomerase/epimerase
MVSDMRDLIREQSHKVKPQHFEIKQKRIQAAFQKLCREGPARLERRLNLSWSNWGFGVEDLEVSADRLEAAGVRFIELHGNHYGPDLGYYAAETQSILADRGIVVGGICGMFSADNDLSSNRAVCRQAAIDYIRREVDFASEVGGEYLLVVPGAVGRPKAYDDGEFERSVETLFRVADVFVASGVKAAIEPIRSAEVSLIHTIAEAENYLRAVAHPGVAHINGDVYHMQAGEAHIGEALLEAGDRLINLHLADSNRCALGHGALDLDTVIMSLYLIGHNAPGRFVTPEPLGPGGDPYPAMYGRPDAEKLDRLVQDTVNYFRSREEVIREELWRPYAESGGEVAAR